MSPPAPPPPTVTATGTVWTATVPALSLGNTITAYATASGKCISTVSNSVTVPIVVGSAYQGGIVAYIFVGGDPGYVAGETHGLIAAINDNVRTNWGCIGTLTSAIGTAIGTGNQDTQNILSHCSTIGIAAKLCDDLVVGGKSDWYLPSKDELLKLYNNRVAIGNFNMTATGLYWSSTEDPASGSHWNSFFYDFSNGTYQAKDKDELYLSRAIRTF